MTPNGHPTRRQVLGCGLCSGLGLLSGCDEAGLVDEAQVEALGLQAWSRIRSSVPETRRGELRAVTRDTTRRLLVATGERPADWEAVVFAAPEVNAFVLPGRKIGIFEGLFGVVQDRDQLATVIGHEIGHLTADHATERIEAQLAGDLGLRLVTWALRQGDIPFAEEIAAALGMGVEVGLVLPYSRRQELEADRLGLATMARAGYDPAAAVSLWQRMDAASGPRPPALLATHPAPEARIREIRALLDQMGAG